ncbi:hypothetical protein RI103_35415 [Paraburkholderia sp. FT54]|uniref:hypothetical protein n=1 Tax=Paraburkholderia sp. FT54 TaxID=3074437 RepID=UPI002877317B|nr:hypothetical protein [Paraburkholderia sp. FT54]WNC94452.1 hypothetical protein RI103_35415 [Paraburkholderia sp. FT54]
MNGPLQSHGERLLMSDESPFGEATATDDSSSASQLQIQALTAVAQISMSIAVSASGAVWLKEFLANPARSSCRASDHPREPRPLR